MEDKSKLRRVFFLFFSLTFLSLLPNLNVYNLRGEEAKRLIPAYEIYKTGDFINLTYLGDIYLNKPPLFYWLTVLSSEIFGWDTITVRAISVFFVFLTAVLIYFFSRYLFRDEKAAVFSSISYITFFDVLFWYGWIGEIDATFTFFIFTMFVLQFIGFTEKKSLFILLSGVFAGLSFLLKGLPSYLFFGINFLVLAIYYRRYFEILRPVYLLSYSIAALIPAVWILSTVKPFELLKTLVYESSQRVKKDTHSLLKHLINYPLTNLKQTLPSSIFLIYLAIRKKIPLNSTVKFLLLVLFINYLPYLLSAGSHGRYIMPLFPVLSLVVGYSLSKSSERLQKVFLITALFFIVLRLLVGSFLVPYIMKKDGNIKEIAYRISEIINDGRIACNCEGSHKSVCFFVDVYEDTITKLPYIEKNWDFLIDCKNLDGGKLISKFKYRKEYIKLYKRDENENQDRYKEE